MPRYVYGVNDRRNTQNGAGEDIKNKLPVRYDSADLTLDAERGGMMTNGEAEDNANFESGEQCLVMLNQAGNDEVRAARAVAEYVQQNAWQIATIKEGLRQLDMGQVYDLDEVLGELDTIIAQEEVACEG
jgi:hypothetical protein